MIPTSLQLWTNYIEQELVSHIWSNFCSSTWRSVVCFSEITFHRQLSWQKKAWTKGVFHVQHFRKNTCEVYLRLNNTWGKLLVRFTWDILEIETHADTVYSWKGLSSLCGILGCISNILDSIFGSIPSLVPTRHHGYFGSSCSSYLSACFKQSGLLACCIRLEQGNLAFGFLGHQGPWHGGRGSCWKWLRKKGHRRGNQTGRSQLASIQKEKDLGSKSQTWVLQPWLHCGQRHAHCPPGGKEGDPPADWIEQDHENHSAAVKKKTWLSNCCSFVTILQDAVFCYLWDLSYTLDTILLFFLKGNLFGQVAMSSHGSWIFYRVAKSSLVQNYIYIYVFIYGITIFPLRWGRHQLTEQRWKPISHWDYDVADKVLKRWRKAIRLHAIDDNGCSLPVAWIVFWLQLFMQTV